MARCFSALITVVAILLFVRPAAAAEKPSAAGITLELSGEEKPDALKRTVEGLAKSGQRVTLRIGGQRDATVVADAAAADGDGGLEAVWDNFIAGLIRGGQGIAFIPELVSDWQSAWNKVSNAQSDLEALIKSGLTILGAMATALALRRLLLRWWPPITIGADATFLERLRRAGGRSARDLASLATFVMVAWFLALHLLPVMDLLRKSVAAVVHYGAIATLYFIVVRFLLAPGEEPARLVPIANADWHIRMIRLYGIFSSVVISTVHIAALIASDRRSVVGWFALVATAITAYKLWWFWTSRRDISQLVLDGADDATTVTAVRRVAAAAMPMLLLFSAVAIWAIGRISVVVPGGERWAGAAGLTQFLIVVVPIVAVGARKAVRELLHGEVAADSRHPVILAAMQVAERGAGWFAWIVGILATAGIWGMLAADAEPSPTLALLNRAATTAAILFAGYVALAFLRALLDQQTPQRRPTMPSAEDETDTTVQSRLASVMPVLRGFLLGAVIAVTVLVALSKLGIDTGPLLAGFGILGLAISFGSQALVRDVVSGVFFMTEDAFRVGEYIDTGKLKGTVEKISLRSVQLRHQSGLVHTVPFGQIAAVTNASRDWSTVKFNIRIDRRADVEKVRKAVKKVGQELQADPEFGGEMILPLKMQGVADIVDNAIICRLKFTAKPARSSWVQREALKRVHKALREANIEFAYNAVMVQSTDGMSPANALGGAVAGQTGDGRVSSP